MTRQYIETKLLELGCNPVNRGFDDIVVAAQYLLDNPNAKNAITKELYPAVAKITGGTASRVERRIRSAIENMFNNDYDNMIRSILNIPVNVYTGKVTNGHFLVAFVMMLSREAENERS